jgi:uncharacterized membrane protein YoaK (UPF0700 family)
MAAFPPLAVALAVAAGVVDAACITRLGQVFAGVMTGNLTLLGLAAARTSGRLAGSVAVALLGYVAGTALGSVLARVGRGARRRAPVTVVLGVEAAVLAGFTAGWVVTAGGPAGAARLGLLAGAAAAMGLQAAAVRSVGTGLSTTYLTGTLTAAVAGLVSGRPPGSAGRWSLAVLVAHASGAGAAGGLLLVVPALVPVLAVVVVVAVLGVLLLRGTAPPATAAADGSSPPSRPDGPGPRPPR